MFKHRIKLVAAGMAVVLGAGMFSLVGTQSAFAAPAALNLTSSSCPSVIQSGQTSGCVTELQNLLKAKGYNPGTVDGIFGANTKSAVIAFQKANGLTQDGLVGTQTKAKLYATATAAGAPAAINLTSSSCPSVIQSGQTSGCVTELQNLLKAKGYNPGTVDGIFGANTLSAVKSFQSANGLTVDGLVGTNTKAKLYGTSASSASGSTVAQKTASLAQSRVGASQATIISEYNARAGTSFGSSTDWCAIFASDMLRQAGYNGPMSAAAESFRPSSSGMGSYFTFISPSTKPQPGDIALWDYEPNGILNHVNIVVAASSASSFTVVGGNQSPNTAVVTQKVPGTSGLVGFARLK
ncbi:MAG: peptidoglycan-binding protein [Propionibacteriaceae bacterium]|nr:peptidoglycan-binding protein [Propionibacteriaceae bacterium]